MMSINFENTESYLSFVDSVQIDSGAEIDDYSCFRMLGLPTPAKAARLVITVDGPAASGKGTLSKCLAKQLRLSHLDTGLLYRSIGKLLQLSGIDPDDAEAATLVAEALTPADLGRSDLRGSEVGELASRIAVHPRVRAALISFQRDFAARSPGGAVLDGRDTGTVICPQADVKFYVTARIEVRAWRRTNELLAEGHIVNYDTVLAEMKARDERDGGRHCAPLQPAATATFIDTSELKPAEVLNRALEATRASLIERSAFNE